MTTEDKLLSRAKAEISLLQDEISAMRMLAVRIEDISQQSVLSRGGGLVEAYGKMLEEINMIAYRIRTMGKREDGND